MTTSVPDAIRDRVYAYLSAAGVEPARGSSDGTVRQSWQINGTVLDGVSASFSDADNVIEFGLLSRVQGAPTNVLNASIVMDDDGARILCTSEVSSEMNFEGPVSMEPASDGLFLAWDYFSQVMGTTAPA